MFLPVSPNITVDPLYRSPPSSTGGHAEANREAKALHTALAKDFENRYFSASLLEAFHAGISHCTGAEKVRAISQFIEIAGNYFCQDSPDATTLDIEKLRSIITGLPHPDKEAIQSVIDEQHRYGPARESQRWLSQFSEMLQNEAQEPADSASASPRVFADLYLEFDRFNRGEISRDFLNDLYRAALKQDVTTDQKTKLICKIMEHIHSGRIRMPRATVADLHTIRAIAMNLTPAQREKIKKIHLGIFVGSEANARNVAWGSVLCQVLDPKVPIYPLDTQAFGTVCQIKGHTFYSAPSMLQKIRTRYMARHIEIG